ncbi:MAG: thermosome subunit beta [Candidatus Diapherotrites archaeon]|nr:thermosome subunit beta [Candidatus Diapherotrites archaeon]
MAEAGPQQREMVFLPEGAKRTRGRNAQQINILVARAVAEAVRSTLGPKGMDKMIVDELGDIIISNDGATILDNISIDHPIGKMMVEVAKTQDSEVGDGTTTVVVLAGGLLEKAEKLLEDEIHPSVIIKGYRMASHKAVEVLNEIADPIDIENKTILREIALTTMTGKSAESEKSLSDIVVDAVLQVAEKQGKETIVDKDQIKIEKKDGGHVSESELIRGIVVDKEIVHSGMPKLVNNARIALIDVALEVKETETDAEISISDPEQLQAFIDKEESMLKEMVDRIAKTKANVVMCQKGIDDIAQHFLAKAGIAACRRVKKSDMEKLSKATGGKLISRLADISEEDLGHAKIVQEKKIGGEAMTFIEGCKNPKSVTILVRGGTSHVVAEVERAVVDAVGSVSTALKDGKIVSGGGSTEMQLSMRLRDYAKTVGGREQLAIECFAEALEIIPKALAETAGMDAIDTLVDLRSKHSVKKGKNIGVNVFKAKLVDMLAEKVIEPMRVKRQAIVSATEVAEMILRIDDIIAGSSKNRGMPPGGMGGMPGGMGDMDM